MVPGTELADPEHSGLRVLCVAGTPAAQNVFFNRYRNPTRALRQTEVGVLVAQLTLTGIRGRWEELRDRIRNGADPREEAKTTRAFTASKVEAIKAEETAKALTVERVIVTCPHPPYQSKVGSPGLRLLDGVVG
jgi:hypothetical protein